MVPAQTFLQERAPVELRGRVFAVQLMLSNFASIVPLLLLGGLADLIGVDKTLVLIGVLIALAGGDQRAHRARCGALARRASRPTSLERRAVAGYTLRRRAARSCWNR